MSPFLHGEQGVNQKIKLGKVYFGEVGGIKSGRVSGYSHFNGSTSFPLT